MLPHWNNTGFTLGVCSVPYFLHSTYFLLPVHGTLSWILPLLFQCCLCCSNSHGGFNTSPPHLGILRKKYIFCDRNPGGRAHWSFINKLLVWNVKIFLVVWMLILGYFSWLCLTHYCRCCSITLSGPGCRDGIWQSLAYDNSCSQNMVLSHSTVSNTLLSSVLNYFHKLHFLALPQGLSVSLSTVGSIHLAHYLT